MYQNKQHKCKVTLQYEHLKERKKNQRKSLDKLAHGNHGFGF